MHGTRTDSDNRAGTPDDSGGGLRRLLRFMGPAIIVSVAYVDPGNFATNIGAGAKYGYELLWVVIIANLIAMLFQALSAKLGIVTGHNLAELSRAHFPRPLVIAMWLVSEVGAMATDLAEFLGAAIGLTLLCGLPLLAGMAVTAIIAFALLMLHRPGVRRFELAIGIMVAMVGGAYLAELAIAPPDWRAAAWHAVVPRFSDTDALKLAVGIVGATVMPHVIFLHSGLTQTLAPRNPVAMQRLLSLSNREVLLALGFVGLVNVAMVAMAARVFFDTGHREIAEIETAYQTLLPLLGAGAAAIFLAALLASGLSSAVVGTMAGQVIMQGFVALRLPLWLRRATTMIPSFVLVALGVNVTDALIASQVVLSLVLPVPMIALLIFTQRRDVMGPYANSRATGIAAAAAVVVTLALNFLYLALLLPALG